jgi:hypothetical protein
MPSSEYIINLWLFAGFCSSAWTGFGLSRLGNRKLHVTQARF